MKRNSLILLFSSGLFILLFYFGLLLAEHKPLWTDEINSQVSLHALSYKDIFLGRIGEGNICPLFYAMQKAFCQFANYQTPGPWMDSEDIYAKIFLRLQPVLFMSLTMVAIFYYFARFHSWGMGFYSFFLSLSSYMVWIYWAEARHYSLWVFLTALQSLLFLRWVQEKKTRDQLWIFLAIVHLLLSVTVIFSLAQIFIVSLLMWIFREEREARFRWIRYVFLSIIPMAISLFYYFHSPHFEFQFALTPEQLIRDSFSRDRFYILFIYTFLLSAYWLGKKWQRPVFLKNDSLLQVLPFWLLTILMLGAAFIILWLFHLKDHGTGFAITNRYFIFLTPIGIIATVLFTEGIIKSLSAYRWIQFVFISGIGYLVIQRFLKMIPHVKSLCAGMFS